MDNFSIMSLEPLLKGSKSKVYQAQVIRVVETFIRFLQEHALCNKTFMTGDRLDDMTVRIMRSDLTDEGFEVVRLAMNKWLRGHDRGKPIEDVSVLEKELKKLRSK